MKNLNAYAFLAGLALVFGAANLNAQKQSERPPIENTLTEATPDREGPTLITPPPPPSLSQTEAPMEYSLYPNPGEGLFYIQGPTGALPKLVRIYALTGQLLQKIEPEGSGDLRIDLRQAKPGIYLIHLGTTVLKYQKH